MIITVHTFQKILLAVIFCTFFLTSCIIDNNKKEVKSLLRVYNKKNLIDLAVARCLEESDLSHCRMYRQTFPNIQFCEIVPKNDFYKNIMINDILSRYHRLKIKDVAYCYDTYKNYFNGNVIGIGDICEKSEYRILYYLINNHKNSFGK